MISFTVFITVLISYLKYEIWNEGFTKLNKDTIVKYSIILNWNYFVGIKINSKFYLASFDFIFTSFPPGT